MWKHILFFLIILLSASCSSHGYYYIDMGHAVNKENVPLNTNDGIKDLSFGVRTIDTDLVATIYVKLLDTSEFNSYNIENISFTLNNLFSEKAGKTIHFIDRPLEVKYGILEEVKDLGQRMHTGLPLEFEFRFNSKQLQGGQDIHVKISIDALYRGRKEHIERNIEMARRTQYRFWGVVR